MSGETLLALGRLGVAGTDEEILDALAEAWDEGYQAGAFDTLDSPKNATTNPYREAR